MVAEGQQQQSTLLACSTVLVRMSRAFEYRADVVAAGATRALLQLAERTEGESAMRNVANAVALLCEDEINLPQMFAEGALRALQNAALFEDETVWDHCARAFARLSGIPSA